MSERWTCATSICQRIRKADVFDETFGVNSAFNAEVFVAALRASRISAFLSIKFWSTGAIFEYLSDCAAAFGTRKQMLITSTNIIVAMTLIILSLVAALIARSPFAVVAAHSPL